LVDDLPLSELDRNLQPVRRLLAWALSRPDEHIGRLRHIEANTARWVNALATSNVPDPVRDGIARLQAALHGVDAAPVERLAEAYAELARLDALLGLPLASPAPLASQLGDLDALEPVTDEVPLDGGGRSSRSEVEPHRPADDGDGDRLVRLGDPNGLGRAIPGIDPDLALALAEEGIETVGDLLLLAPTRYEAIRPVHGAGRDLPRGRVAVSGRVVSRTSVLTPGAEGLSIRHELVLAGAGALRVVWTNRPPVSLLDHFPVGARVVFVGEHTALSSLDGVDDAALVDPESVTAEQHVAYLAEYGLEGVPDEAVRALIWRHLPEIDRVRDPLPSEVVSRTGLAGLAAAVRDVHTRGPVRPQARRRLAFDEALLAQMGLAHPRFGAVRERGINHAVLHGWVARATQLVERPLDDQQQSAFEDIKRDLQSGTPMNRVMCGESASGKTWVALLTLLMICESRLQVLWLCADDRAAERRLANLDSVLKEFGLVARHLTGDPSRNQRDAIRRGDVSVIFGASELLDREIEFRRLGLVIAEEVPAFVSSGVGSWGRTPARIAPMKAPRPDVLVLSHAPIPSGILLTAFGECDLSIVDSAKARPAPTCTVLPDAQRDDAYSRLRAALATGGQGYVLFPSAPDGTDLLDLREAKSMVEVLETGLWEAKADHSRVGLMHGTHAPGDRAKTLDDFRHRRFDVLLSTVPIDEGSPAATVAVVEQADRFDAWRLLRIRGLVSARPTGPAGQLLLVGAATPLIDGLAAGWDGWEVMEWELEQRGQAALLAREVPNAVRLRWALPREDRDLLLLAREEAHRILEQDPSLRRPANQDLARALRDRWDDLLTVPAEPSAASAGGRKRRRRRKKK
jgi:ATP-dependent DNA helicase RecG